MDESAPYQVLDLFSGIGGFSLGLERAGMRTVAFCESDAFCRCVLAQHWPNIPCYDDIRTLTSDRLRADGIAVDIACGGFPCQDISNAGKGAGIAGKHSGLWKEFARIIGEIRPRYVIVENVAALLGRGLDQVLGDLATLGFDAEWHCIPASAVGAPHLRDRIWIIAYPQHPYTYNERSYRTSLYLRSSEFRDEQGCNTGPFCQDVADANARRELQQEGIIGHERGWAGDGSWWGIEPDVGRVAHGVPARVDRLRCLGNAVVPQVVEILGRAIMEREFGYDGAHGHNDMNRSLKDCYAAIRARMAAGGPGWEP